MLDKIDPLIERENAIGLTEKLLIEDYVNEYNSGLPNAAYEQMICGYGRA